MARPYFYALPALGVNFRFCRGGLLSSAGLLRHGIRCAFLPTGSARRAMRIAREGAHLQSVELAPSPNADR
jgi:hypothetical protein